MAERGSPYPVAERRDVPGDPYRWLEDAGAEATRAWSLAQDELYRETSIRWRTLPRRRGEMAEAFAVSYVSPPRWRGERRFFVQRDEHQEHPVLYVERGPGGGISPLLDPMRVDQTGRTTLDRWEPSPGGGRVACQLSVSGSEQSMIHVLDVPSGTLVGDPIGPTRYSPIAWLGEDSFCYVRDGGVRLRRLSHGDDAEVFSVPGTVCRDLALGPATLLVTLKEQATARDQLWLADLRTEPWRFRHADVGAAYHVRAAPLSDGRVVLQVDDVPAGRLCVTRLDGRAWREVTRGRDGAVLASFTVLDGAGAIVADLLRDGCHTLTLHDLGTGDAVATVPLPGRGVVRGLARRPGGHELWFSYTDHAHPERLCRYDARTGATISEHVPPQGARVHTRQVDYPSTDGIPVTMFVVTPEAAPTRPRPAILGVYGGFGTPLSPAYLPALIPWVESGGVYALAGVRGGGERGAAWHRAGVGPRKQKSVDDLHAAASWLIANGYTTPGGLGVTGTSNGGLLAAAAVVQRPELYGAAVCVAPPLDMARFHLSGLGARWIPEYGNPDDPAELAWLLGYAPYQNVREGTAYPALLCVAFDGDTRVDPMHARKFTAALQHATTGEGPVLLRVERNVGHGARAMSRVVELSAEALAFFDTYLDLPRGG